METLLRYRLPFSYDVTGSSIKVWLFIIVISFAGCKQCSPSAPLPDAAAQPGSVTDNVSCAKHPGFSYAIYVPTCYTAGDTLPVFLSFDPAGSGIRPVTAYKDIAEKYRFILIGSNDSRNGQSLDQTWEVASAMLTEIGDILPACSGVIYCMGFSGGSRVSSILAFYRGGIRGVVGCGAGFPGMGTGPRFLAGYYGLVGNRDFNFLEMISLEDYLNEMKIPHSLHIFDGKHDWPPAPEMEKAVRWHICRAMEQGSIHQNPSFIRDVAWQDSLDITVIAGLDPEILKKEKRMQESYREAMMQQPVPWWKREVKSMLEPSDPVMDLMNQRLLAYCSMLAYTISSHALKESNRPELERIISIYETVDPGNGYIASLKERLSTLPR